MRTVAFCEIDPWCRAVLRKHWPDVPVYDDVRTLTAARLVGDTAKLQRNGGKHHARGNSESADTFSQSGNTGGIDVICGGFPCQDISNAGKGAGITGERSGLWKEYARIIGEVRPRYAIIENVAALLHRGLSDVLFDLSEIGYDAEWHCIRASDVGAPHRRDRVWIVAYPGHRPFTEWSWQAGREAWERSTERSKSGCDGTTQYVADADQPRLEGWLRAGLRQCAGQQPFGSRGAYVADAACELLDGSGAAGSRWRGQPSDGGWWLAEPDVGRVVDGISTEMDGDRLDGQQKLSALQQANDPSAMVERETGCDFQKQKILQPDLLRSINRAAWAGQTQKCEEERTATCENDLLQSMRTDDKIAEASQGSEYEEQQSEQHRSALPGVSHARSFAGWHMGEPPDTPRVAVGVRDRVNRLRSLGNAVVPAIPEIIGRAIMSAQS